MPDGLTRCTRARTDRKRHTRPHTSDYYSVYGITNAIDSPVCSSIAARNRSSDQAAVFNIYAACFSDAEYEVTCMLLVANSCAVVWYGVAVRQVNPPAADRSATGANVLLCGDSSGCRRRTPRRTVETGRASRRRHSARSRWPARGSWPLLRDFGVGW